MLEGHGHRTGSAAVPAIRPGHPELALRWGKLLLLLLLRHHYRVLLSHGGLGGELIELLLWLLLGLLGLLLIGRWWGESHGLGIEGHRRGLGDLLLL